MKKHIFYVAAAIVLAGCSVESLDLEQTPNSGERVVTINATIEGFEGDTKTSYTDDLEHSKALVSWSAGDVISILYSDGGYKKRAFTTPLGDGKFTGTVSGTEGGTYGYWAIYPYNICTDLYGSDPKESTAITLPSEYNGNGADGIPMLAYYSKSKGSFDNTYRFKHLGAVLRFKFSHIPSTARELVISYDEQEIAGLFRASYDSVNDLYTYTYPSPDDDGTKGVQKAVTYRFTPGGDGTYSFYLPFGTISPSGNFTFTFKNAAGESICSRTTTLGTLASTTLARNTMYRVNLDALSFDGYPLSHLTIGPSDVPNVSSSEEDFTVGGVTFHGVMVSDYEYNSGNNIKLYKDGDSKSSRIYNKTDFGRIVRIVVSAGSQNYYNDSFTVYAGSSANPITTNLSYSSHESGVSSTYIFTSGDYHFFTFRINSTDNNQYLGTIDIYYVPNS